MMTASMLSARRERESNAHLIYGRKNGCCICSCEKMHSWHMYILHTLENERPWLAQNVIPVHESFRFWGAHMLQRCAVERLGKAIFQNEHTLTRMSRDMRLSTYITETCANWAHPYTHPQNVVCIYICNNYYRVTYSSAITLWSESRGPVVLLVSSKYRTVREYQNARDR